MAFSFQRMGIRTPRHVMSDGPLEEAMDGLKTTMPKLGRLGLVSSGQEAIDGPYFKLQ
ncbi:MAG: hypothetical protein OXE77_01570 [Flavobacteriaceae bacterium]|nr:hypothetical protein [Flavobacteriaceae bacterium]MCY4268524.1 hypothetical protein [Flavobacteriaceae bacterium]